MNRNKIIVFLTLVFLFLFYSNISKIYGNNNGFYNASFKKNTIDCDLTYLTLFERMSVNKFDNIIDEIETSLKLNYKDEIIHNFNPQNQDTFDINSDSLFKTNNKSNKNELSYYTIDKGYFWFTDFTDAYSPIYMISRSNHIKKFLLIFNTNQLKACYWLWQIYTNNYDSLDLAYFTCDSCKSGRGYNFYEYKEEAIWDTVYSDSNKKEKYELIPKQSIMRRIPDVKEVFQKLYKHCLDWIELYKKYGLEEMRKRKLSPVPEGYKWFNIGAIIKN